MADQVNMRTNDPRRAPYQLHCGSLSGSCSGTPRLAPPTKYPCFTVDPAPLQLATTGPPSSTNQHCLIRIRNTIEVQRYSHETELFWDLIISAPSVAIPGADMSGTAVLEEYHGRRMLAAERTRHAQISLPLISESQIASLVLNTYPIRM